MPPTYMGSGDPARRGHDYYPWWLDNLAEDVTGEGAFMQGVARGAEAVRSIVTYARELYQYQEFSFHDQYGDSGFLELYTTQVRDQPAGVVVTVTRNAAGKAQHLVVNHRPRSSVLLVARLCGEKFAGTPLGKLFNSLSPEADSTAARGATYLGSGDPARRRTDYFPAWLNNLADDVTLEAAAMEGFAQGPEAVRSITVAAKELYEYQDFNYAGSYGANGFLEDYTTQVRGEPTGVVVTVTRDVADKTQHLVVNHRPRSSMLLVSRLLGETFAGTPQAKHFLSSES
jgi:hypothetical protein